MKLETRILFAMVGIILFSELATPTCFNRVLNFCSRTLESDLLLTISTDKDLCHPGESLTVLGKVQDISGTLIEGATIGIEVQDSNNNTVFLDIVFSQPNGTYQDSFRLHENSALGVYNVYVTASMQGYPTARNQTTFTVEAPTRLLGDVNLDGIVDMRDLYLIAINYGKTAPYESLETANCDVDKNGIINMLDLYIAAVHFGETDP